MEFGAGSSFTVLGTGPVALACALRCARIGSVTLLAEASTVPARASWVEVVPRQAIAGLFELGVPPHAIGVAEWAQQKTVAWAHAEPATQMGPAAAHLERPALERVLLTLVHREKNVQIHVGSASALRTEAMRRATLGRVVFDATGRRAVLAKQIERPSNPWVARVFHLPRPIDRVAPRFMLAALEQGYVYRAEGRSFTTIGVVGRGSLILGTAEPVRQRLLQSDACWLVADLERRTWVPVGAKVASMQLASGEGVASVGDAGFARDALSSQGLASGLRDACYAGAVNNAVHMDALAERSRLQQQSHARAVTSMISECRFHDAAIWKAYNDYITARAN